MYNILPIIFLIIFIFCLTQFSKCEKKTDANLKKVEQGKMTVLTYNGHTYIAWSINMGGGIVHDPDCECLRRDK